MSTKNTFVGMDVHEDSITTAGDRRRRALVETLVAVVIVVWAPRDYPPG